MRTILFLTIAALMITPLPAAHAGECDPSREHCDKICDDREHPCTDVSAGTMECMPEIGEAAMLSSVVGSEDSGTFRLQATGTNLPGSDSLCEFHIVIDMAGVTFNTGWVPELVGSPGAVTSTSSTPCYAAPGESCEAEATFTWWRAVHGVTFDVPFILVVNGQEVARGTCHYYDPPAWQELFGGDLVLA